MSAPASSTLDVSEELSVPTVRRVEQGRLAYYRRAADAAYWEAHWQDHIQPEWYADALRGNLGAFESLFTKHLPKVGSILEAGCGPAHWVVALRARGYAAEGVDWAAATITRVKALFPDLPVRQEDVCALDVADGHYAAYISLGVIEHRRDGPDPFLREAKRVLAPGGMAIFSVPWFNPLRRLKALSGAFGGAAPENLEFYQYAYRAGEIIALLEQVGFVLVDHRSSPNIQMGFEDELPTLQAHYRRGRMGRGLKRVVRAALTAVPRFGHTHWYVCRKP